jgi:hypothetical protein
MLLCSEEYNLTDSYFKLAVHKVATFLTKAVIGVLSATDTKNGHKTNTVL